MVWICPCCSTANEATEPECTVCGAARPATAGGGKPAKPAKPHKTDKDDTPDKSSAGCQVVFTTLSDIAASLRELFTFRPAKQPEDKAPKDKTPKEKKPKTKAGKDDTPWPEHNIVFCPDIITQKGFTQIKRHEANGIHGYLLVKADGTTRFVQVKTLLMQKLAETKH